MTPLFTSPCDLAERIPDMVADFLELETQVGRRFREDSVTDILIASLLKIGGPDATVFTPPEVKTGGDFDLVIYQPGTGIGVQYRIQSKRLVSNATNWSWSSYRELDHPHGSGRQASTLIRSSAHESMPTIPLYAFYNPASVCDASTGEIAGIHLADGRAIGTIVRALVKARAAGKRPRWKRLEILRHLFFPLSTILCPPTHEPSGGSAIIHPEVSRRAVLNAIEERRSRSRDTEDIPPRIRLEFPEALNLPSIIPRAETSDLERELPLRHRRSRGRSVIDLAASRQPTESHIQHARIKRPKLVLLSR